MSTTDATLTPAIAEFLAAPHFASIATIDPDGSPRQTVAWYRLERDGRILVNSRTPRRWCTNLLRDPRVALSVVDGANAYRWVGIVGRVDEIIEDPERARDDIVALAHRYHPEGPSEASIAAFRSEPRVSFLIRIAAVHDYLKG